MGSLSYLNKYFYKYKFRFILGIVFIIISNIFAIIPAQIIREAINLVDKSLSKDGGELEIKYLSSIANDLSITEVLLLFASLVIVMAILKGLFTFFMRQTIIVMSRLIEFDLKNEIYQQYQVLSPTFYKTHKTGDIMNRISEDVTRVRMYLGPGVMYSINMVVLFTLVITTMLSINVKLTVFALLPLPFLSGIIYYVSNVINRKSEEVQGQLSEISNAAQETFSGIRVLKSYVREDYAIEQYDQKSNNYKNLALSLVKVEALFMPIMSVLIGLSTILTIYIGGRESIAGKLEIGNIAEFVIYVNMLTWPVTALGWVTSLTQRASASQRRINEFLQEKPEFLKGGQKEFDLKGKISFKAVNFSYKDSGITALKNVEFDIKAGATMGIIGKTGSGKSSLIDLMCRNIKPDSGTITFDDIDLTSIDIQYLRSQMGIVPQEGFLFSDTILNNIAFGAISKEIDKELVFSAARDAEIFDNINDFPEKFDTLVGERGITLSGGQKQRISIARALVRSPKILVFDDCLSAVDSMTERNILNNLKEKLQGRTSIIVSHRVSAVKQAQEIIVMDKGEVIERGDHKTLLDEKGVYFEMFTQQKMEKQEDIHIIDSV